MLKILNQYCVKALKIKALDGELDKKQGGASILLVNM